MGGQEGSRGYLYQAIVSIVEGCISKEWESISVEEDTPKDKVDIAFYNSVGGLLSAIQVKSSVNSFDVADIINWIKAMIDDVNSERYELYLIGNCGKKATTFIKSINKYYDGKLDKEAEESLQEFLSTLKKHTITVELLPYKQEYLLSIASAKLNELIGTMGYMIDAKTLKQLTYALITANIVWGTEQERVSKGEYVKSIEDWIKCSVPRKLKSLTAHSMLEVGCYNFKSKLITQEGYIYSVYVNYDFEDEITLLKKRGNELFSIVNEIKLSPYIPDDGEEKWSELSASEKAMKAMTKDFFPVEMQKKQKDELNKGTKKYLGFELPDDFCNVGNLKKGKFFKETREEVVGTLQEQKKAELLSEFSGVITELNKIDCFREIIKPICFLPLCIKNIGDITDENITVIFKTAKTKLALFDLNDDLDEESKEMLRVFAEWILNDEDNVLERVFAPHENENIRIFNTINIPYSRKSHTDFFGNSIEMQFVDLVEGFSYYQAKTDAMGNVVYDIPTLRAGECVWLSPFMLVNNEHDSIQVQYSIISKQLGEEKGGLIHINKDGGNNYVGTISNDRH